MSDAATTGDRTFRELLKDNLDNLREIESVNGYVRAIRDVSQLLDQNGKVTPFDLMRLTGERLKGEDA